MINFKDKKDQIWKSGMFGKGVLDWGYGPCLFLAQIKEDVIVVIDQYRKEFSIETQNIFDNIPFEPISESEYAKLKTDNFDEEEQK